MRYLSRMFEIVEEYIYQRLRRIIHNDRPITVYRYEPHRDKGNPEYPCISFERARFDIDYTRAKPDGIYFEACERLSVINLNPSQSVRGEFEERHGPDCYTIKAYPMPINIFYYLTCYATEKSHADYIQMSLPQAFPQGFMPDIGGQSPLMSLSQIEGRDDLSVPMFEVDCVLSVEGIWVERLVPRRTVPAIRVPELHMDVSGTNQSTVQGGEE